MVAINLGGTRFHVTAPIKGSQAITKETRSVRNTLIIYLTSNDAEAYKSRLNRKKTNTLDSKNSSVVESSSSYDISANRLWYLCNLKVLNHNGTSVNKWKHE